MLGSRFLGDPLAGGMPTLEVRQQPLPDRRRERRLRAPPVRVPHRPAGLQPGTSSRPIPYAAQQRRLRVRPGAHRPGRGGRHGAAGSARSRSRRATSRRPSSVGFRRSVVYGLSTLRVVGRYLLHRLRVRRSPKLTARRRRDRLSSSAGQPMSAARCRGDRRDRHLDRRPRSGHRPRASTSPRPPTILRTAIPAWIVVMLVAT